MNSPRLHLYGCGGAGLNIVGAMLKENLSKDETSIRTSFIDTSHSNIKPGMKQEDIYVLPNVDGSGKKRDENHQEINNVIKEILVKHKPSIFNIVIFSLSGGSGSVIGPLLISEMLERNIPVIGICIGTDESVLTANNTLNTLKSLDVIAKRKSKPVVIVYEHNERGSVRSSVDTRICSYIGAIAYLVSGNNDELDSQDLINWLDFTRTTTLGPQVALLDVYSDTAHVEVKHSNPVSVASLYAHRDTQGLNVVPEYHCAGYTDLTEAKVDQLHFVIDVMNVPSIAKRINETLKAQREVAESRPQQGSLASDKDSVSDTGLIL